MKVINYQTDMKIIEKLKLFIAIGEIKFIIKIFPQRKYQVQIALLVCYIRFL